MTLLPFSPASAAQYFSCTTDEQEGYEYEHVSSDGNHLIRLTSQSLESFHASSFLLSPSAGAISIFSGTTREIFNGKLVKELSYECYYKLVIKQLQQLSLRLQQGYDAVKSVIIHRLGNVPVGETSVIIGMSSVHRNECLNGVEWCINELKHRVAIWKREVYNDGSVWKQNAEWNVNQLTGDWRSSEQVNEAANDCHSA